MRRNRQPCNILEQIRNNEKLYPNNYRDMQNFNRFMDAPIYNDAKLPEWKIKAINGPSRKSYYHPKPLEDRFYRNKVGPYNDNVKVIKFNNWHRNRDPFYENGYKGRTQNWEPGTRKGDMNFRLPSSLITQNSMRPLLNGNSSWEKTIEEKTGIVLPTGADKTSVPRKRNISVLNTHLNKYTSPVSEPRGRRDIKVRDPYLNGIREHVHKNNHVSERRNIIYTLNKMREQPTTKAEHNRANNISLLNTRSTNLTYAPTDESMFNRRLEVDRQKQNRINNYEFEKRNHYTEGYTTQKEVYIGNQIKRPPQFRVNPTYYDMVQGNLTGVANYNSKITEKKLNPINSKIDFLLEQKLMRDNTFP